MMRVFGLSAGYGSVPVVSDVDLELWAGEFVMVIGPNAAGKTTFLKTLAGLAKPVKGVIYLSGEDMRMLGLRQRARNIAAVLTGRPDVSGMLVEEVVGLGRYAWTGPLHMLAPVDKQAVEDAMKKTGVAHLRGRRVSELSDGQLQRVLIARALAQQPRILILDEPTTHLDAKSRLEIITLLHSLAHRENLTVIASTHELELALRFADRLILIAEGKAIVADDPAELIKDQRFIKAFGLADGVTLSHTTLSIEYRPHRNSGGARVFVIAGAGTGAGFYRLLLKTGYDVVTGVLHENDVDHHVAASLGLDIVSERPYTRISWEKLSQAEEKMCNASAVVYTSPPLGEQNMGNYILLEKAIEHGLPTYVVGAVHSGAETIHTPRELVAKLIQTQASGREALKPFPRPDK